MYNYLGILRKSTAVDHCVTCNFFDSKTPTLILSKNNRLEFYIFQEEKLTPKKYINVFGKIKILLTIPSKNDKDNIFILSQDLNFCLFSYNFSHNNIDIPITGSIKEDLGKIQDEFLYCLDGNKNYATMHVVSNDNVKEEIRSKLKDIGIDNVTIELENTKEKCLHKECH